LNWYVEEKSEREDRGKVVPRPMNVSVRGKVGKKKTRIQLMCPALRVERKSGKKVLRSRGKGTKRIKRSGGRRIVCKRHLKNTVAGRKKRSHSWSVDQQG